MNVGKDVLLKEYVNIEQASSLEISSYLKTMTFGKDSPRDGLASDQTDESQFIITKENALQ